MFEVGLVVVDVGDVVDGKCVTKGRLLGDLGEPRHKSQLGGGRPEGKGEGQKEKCSHHNTFLLGINPR